MAYRDRRTLNIIIAIVAVVIVTIITLSIIILNVITSDWGFYEIFTTIGGTFMIVGGIGIWGTYAGGYTLSFKRMDAVSQETMNNELAYARKKRSAVPIVSYILFGIGVIFLAIGLSGLWK